MQRVAHFCALTPTPYGDRLGRDWDYLDSGPGPGQSPPHI